MHASGFNLGLLMRTLFGIGTPRALQGRAAVVAVLGTAWHLVYDAVASLSPHVQSPSHFDGPTTRWITCT